MHGFRWHLKCFILTPNVCFCKAQASTDVPSHLEPVFEAESLAFHGLAFQPPPSSYLRDKQIELRARQVRWLSPGIKSLLCFLFDENKNPSIDRKAAKIGRVPVSPPSADVPIVNTLRSHGVCCHNENPPCSDSVSGCQCPVILQDLTRMPACPESPSSSSAFFLTLSDFPLF